MYQNSDGINKDNSRNQEHRRNSSNYMTRTEFQERLKKLTNGKCMRCGKTYHTESHPKKHCEIITKCYHCQNNHLARFCVRKSKREDGVFYAMEYDGKSEDSESEDEGQAKMLGDREESNSEEEFSSGSEVDEEEYVKMLGDLEESNSEGEFSSGSEVDEKEHIKMILNIGSNESETIDSEEDGSEADDTFRVERIKIRRKKRAKKDVNIRRWANGKFRRRHI